MFTCHPYAQPLHVHGVFLDVLGLGVLITGQSGIGKSELALGLINRGHKFIADDVIELTLNEDNHLIGRCPPLLQDFLEVRGLGILDIRAMHGDNTIKPRMELQFIVNLVNMTQQELSKIDRSKSLVENKVIFDKSIPKMTLPVIAGRNLSILLETGVRNQLLKNSGYNAIDIFRTRQRDVLEKNNREVS